MSQNIVRLEVHKDLKQVLEDLRCSVANDMKLKYGLNEIVVPRTLSSQILAAKLQGKKTIGIKINKTSSTKGFLEFA